ncbi:serine hydrolase domain-containing protein [Bradyrhizobium sp. Tv2a-2]|uniref:serine hydrolase domain-containing protein n=1 Tax=Bradyrhizobium sp. Tv2a-2 TaxID=113395 RepID=UPI00040C6430|nr:serine hydrolase domain-containing protein [Bradyrhizobium sp. Tv2a-2]
MPDIGPIQRALEAAIGPDKIPGIAAAVATRDGVIFEGAAGRISVDQPAPMTADSVFRIASMTKAITGAAAMQLVEQGKLALDQPAKEILPLLGKVQVLTGFDASGPTMRRPRTDVTLRHLLTHTAGFAYDIWNADIARYAKEKDVPAMRTGKLAALNVPLVRDPGERWEYGVNIEMVGRMVEAASGLNLETYLQKHILMPLGMRDTSYIARASWESRLTGVHARKADGKLEPIASPPVDETTREFFPGGGGLYSTAPDYLRFLRALLSGGELDGARILKSETVALMGGNHMGALNVEPLPTFNPALSNPVDLMPGVVKKWGLTFLINTEATPAGRSAGSLAWAGLNNTYYWLDPSAKVAAVFMTQVLPFADTTVLEALDAFESAVYQVVRKA